MLCSKHSLSVRNIESPVNERLMSVRLDRHCHRFSAADELLVAAQRRKRATQLSEHGTSYTALGNEVH